jgi:DNA-binding HxlR family transcriptional regulator
LAGNSVTGRDGSGARAGARTLNMLAAPLNAQILRALRDGPKQQADLRREAGYPAQTTLRAQLKGLVAAAVIEKRRRNRFPGTLQYELSDPGRDLLTVAETLEAWLAKSPTGQLELGSGAAKAAVKALAEGWAAGMLQALVDAPLTLTELDRSIDELNYPSIERRLAAMRLAGLVEALAGDTRGTPHAPTGWARESMGPIAAAIRWEQRQTRQSSVG